MASIAQSIPLWSIRLNRDEIVCRIVVHDDAAVGRVHEVRLSFNGTRFHSRMMDSSESAGVEAQTRLDDYLGRGWVVVPPDVDSVHH